MAFTADESTLSYDFFGRQEPLEQIPFLDPIKSETWYLSDEDPTLIERPREKTLDRDKDITCSSADSRYLWNQSRFDKPANYHHAEVDPKKFYTKNACKNIIKQSLRSIQKRQYEDTLKQLCLNSNVEYDHFYKSILQYLESISGPSALKRLLGEKEIGKVYREYLRWYLKERYLREAVQKGHMNHLTLYVYYKNSVLLRLV